MGKTFTVDPISKRRLDNFGEEDKFYIKDHHEAIISIEDVDKAQEIRIKRASNRNTVLSKGGKREKYSRKYAFSSLLECKFCGANLSRRSWHSKTEYEKVIWQCVVGTKKGKKHCPESKGIEEKAIERAFVESYKQLCSNNQDVVEKFLSRVEKTLNDSSIAKDIKKLDNEITSLLIKQNSLVDLRLDNKINEKIYEDRYVSLQNKYLKTSEEKESLEFNLRNENNIKKRMKEFKDMLERNEILKEFDRFVFESIVDKVIVGDIDENKNIDPYKLTFVYKTGFTDNIDGSKFKTPRKNEKDNSTNNVEKPTELCSHSSDEVNK